MLFMQTFYLKPHDNFPFKPVYLLKFCTVLYSVQYRGTRGSTDVSFYCGAKYPACTTTDGVEADVKH